MKNVADPTISCVAQSKSLKTQSSKTQSSKTESKALFLDRDGVINVDHGYVGHYKDFEYLDGIFELVKSYSDYGYKIVIVTNQSGIARGLYTEQDFSVLMNAVKADFAQRGVGEIAIYYCPHHVEGAIAQYAVPCNCRKPKPGMLLQAADDLAINLTASILIGDSWRDIEAAHEAGISKSYYLSEQAMPKSSEITSVIQVTQLNQVPHPHSSTP